MFEAFFPLLSFLAAGHFIQHRNRFVDLFQDGVFHHLSIDHLLQLELVQRQNADHLHQAWREDLALSDLQVQFGLQKRHSEEFGFQSVLYQV